MRTRILLLAIIGLLLIAAGAPAAPKINVISVGDSWANQWCEDLQWVILTHGVAAKVWNFGIYGTTSTIWASPGALLEVQLHLLDHPKIDWAVVSLGGNDLLDGYLLGGYGEAVFPIVEDSIRVVIDGLLAIRPNLRISLNGYDFPNFEHTLECILMGQAMLGGNTYDQNLLIARLTQIAADIAADYPQVYCTELLGTLQEADGVPNPPNYYRPSPARFYIEDECVHPRGGGYWYLMQRLYDNFFEPLNVADDDDDDNDDDNDDNDDDDNDNDDNDNDDNDNDNNDDWADDDNDDNDHDTVDDDNDDNDDDNGDDGSCGS
ncbi:MAG: SGNH/GDSL hydrolase family protein [Myxococcales bacterium]|nr:SGNH/GDSL hydrolase family protein [Myxococcales bacterium]